MNDQAYGLDADDIDRICKVFKRYPVVVAAQIYGSRALGNHRPGSDIDLTLKGDGLDLKTLNRISNDLDDLLLPYIFDLSIYSQIKNDALLEHIERVGRVFYEKI